MGLSQMCEKIIAVTTVAVRQAELFTTRVKALGHENQHLHPANAPNREYPCEGENHIGELVVCATDLTRRTMDVLLAQCEQPLDPLSVDNVRQKNLEESQIYQKSLSELRHLEESHSSISSETRRQRHQEEEKARDADLQSVEELHQVSTASPPTEQSRESKNQAVRILMERETPLLLSDMDTYGQQSIKIDRYIRSTNEVRRNLVDIHYKLDPNRFYYFTLWSEDQADSRRFHKISKRTTDIHDSISRLYYANIALQNPSPGLRCYTVITVCVDEQCSPLAVDIPLSNTFPCCQPPCESVKVHLEHLWKAMPWIPVSYRPIGSKRRDQSLVDRQFDDLALPDRKSVV